MKKPLPLLKNYALISGGVVESIMVSDDEFAEIMRAEYDAVIDTAGTVAYVGGKYESGQFVPRPPEPKRAEVAPAA